jgi:hypothetical protein
VEEGLKPLKPEIQAIVELLDQDHEDIYELARTILVRAFALYEARPDVGVLFRQDDTPIVVRGFSGSKLDVAMNAAIKWAQAQGLAEGEAVLTVIKTQEQV